MSITITNQTRQLLIVTLNSGASVHLPPGGTSSRLEDLEIADNPKIAKLAAARVVSIEAA